MVVLQERIAIETVDTVDLVKSHLYNTVCMGSSKQGANLYVVRSCYDKVNTHVAMHLLATTNHTLIPKHREPILLQTLGVAPFPFSTVKKTRHNCTFMLKGSSAVVFTQITRSTILIVISQIGKC